MPAPALSSSAAAVAKHALKKKKTSSSSSSSSSTATLADIQSMPIDKSQCAKAVKALIAYVEKNKEESSDLLSESQFLWVIVSTKRISDQTKLKPVRIPLQHSLIADNAEVLLLTKDPQRKFKDLFAEKNIKGVSKIMGISKLRDRYKPHEAKRQLCREYDMFLADDAIIPLLPRLLGKTFFEKKKQPIPVDLKAKNLQNEIDRALNATYMHLGHGSCHAIKFGNTEMTPTEILENLMTALPAIVDKIPRKWSNVQSINIKTNSSVALPIYCSLPDEGDDETAAVTEKTETKSKEAPKEEKAASKNKKQDIKKQVTPPAKKTKTSASTTSTTTKEKKTLGEQVKTTVKDTVKGPTAVAKKRKATSSTTEKTQKVKKVKLVKS